MSLSALVAWVFMAAPPPAPAPPREDADAITRARVCWAALDADCAEVALAECRGMFDMLPADEIMEVLRLSAEVALSSDRGADARAHIQAALERDPRFAPDGWPAAWLAVVDEVRKILPDRLPPELAPELPESAPPTKPLRVAVRARDASGVASVTVTAAGVAYACLTADGELWSVELPRDIVKVPDLSLDIAAIDRAGNSARVTRVVPVIIPPKPPEPDVPLTSRWWFWTAIGAGAAALVTGAVLLAGGESDGLTPARTGSIGILPEWP